MEHQEIDFSYSLGEFGWSNIYIAHEQGDLAIRTTHVFNHPLIELLESVISLLKGEKTAEFFWFDEPGSYKVTLEVDADQQHLINFSIIEYASTGKWNENDRTISECSFCVKLQHVSACIYGEMVKLKELMNIGTYSKNRNSEYPYSYVKEFMKEYSIKYS
ncbi:hypothetical protein TDB9533_02845 [Thalassocella blandensis]|nr:hypothetical protein TDB9533_02845 [Thalassocella blandensis]